MIETTVPIDGANSVKARDPNNGVMLVLDDVWTDGALPVKAKAPTNGVMLVLPAELI